LSVVFRPEAEAEISQAAQWYEARANGLGSEFVRSLEAAIANIERHPLAYQIVFGEVRRALLRRFPYAVFFKHAQNETLVIACFHLRRDPAQWQERT